MTFDDGKGPVVIVAELGQAEDLHFLPPPKNGKKKTPFQIHREERRKAEVEKVLTVKKISQQNKITVLANESEETDFTKVVHEFKSDYAEEHITATLNKAFVDS